MRKLWNGWRECSFSHEREACKPMPSEHHSHVCCVRFAKLPPDEPHLRTMKTIVEDEETSREQRHNHRETSRHRNHTVKNRRDTDGAEVNEYPDPSLCEQAGGMSDKESSVRASSEINCFRTPLALRCGAHSTLKLWVYSVEARAQISPCHQPPQGGQPASPL